MRVVLIAMIALFGCLKADLPRCGDLTCPENSTCLDGRCVPREAAAACASRADAEPCSTSQLPVGVCSSQLCVAPGCGNGVTEVDEVCDDGNQLAGDGCSEACDSLEQCGDGVTNVNEECDCGTDPLLVTTPCVAINSNTLDDASCREDCTLKACNNGIVEALEECEPTVAITDVTCQTLGFYGGTVACSTRCRFDVSACAGECGDGVVDPLEACDGADLGAFASCTQIGFYRGTLGCNAACNYTGCNGRCGDGTRDGSDGEACDKTDVPTCGSLGFYGIGTPGCTAVCSVTAGNCERCGDGIRQASFEQCDATDLGGKTCADFDMVDRPGEGLACGAACTFDLSGCTRCGNGLCNLGEDCNTCMVDCCCLIDIGTGQCDPSGCLIGDDQPPFEICS